jgi:hypothetical protein
MTKMALKMIDALIQRVDDLTRCFARRGAFAVEEQHLIERQR